MTRQQKLDAYARKLGYPSYYALRNARAKAEGFSSYTAKRRAQLIRRDVAPPAAFDEHPSIVMSRDLRNAYRQAGRDTTDVALRASRISVLRDRTQSVKDNLTRPVLATFGELDQRVKDFYTHDFPGIYEAGARAANRNYQLSGKDRKKIADLTRVGASGLIQNNQVARNNAKRLIPELVDAPPPEAFKIANKRPIKGKVYSNGHRVGFQTYAEMAIRANAARAYNTGFLTALADGDDSKLVQVSDGEDCGWRHHDDSELANGKIVTIEEAMEFPIAHPNCVRQFSAAPAGAEGPLRGALRKAKRIAKASAKATVKANAVALAVHVAADQRVRDAAAKVVMAARADFRQFQQNVRTVAQLMEYARRTRIAAAGNVTNVADITGARITADQVIEDVMGWMDDFADGGQVPEHVLKIIGVPRQAGRKAIGDNLDAFTTFYNASTVSRPATLRPITPVRLPTKEFGAPARRGRTIGQQVKKTATDTFLERMGAHAPITRFWRPGLTLRQGIERVYADEFYRWLTGKVPQTRLVRLTFPNINKSIGILDRPRRIRFAVTDLAKVTFTSVKDRGVFNHLSLNPNGLIRLSLTRDPETKRVIPTFRLIPPGPLHIMTRVNRGIHGNITSLSGEVRLVTKRVPLNRHLALRFNLNLRKLGLESLSDIKKLRLEDYRKLDREDLRGVSLAANLRLRGFNLFDIARTFRLPWEEAEKLWHLTNYELEQYKTEFEALRARRKFTLIQGGNPLGVEIPDLPVPPRPVLRLVDPVKGDPLGPGGAVSKSRVGFTTVEAQKITVPGKFKSVPARRLYIESQLTPTERERVRTLRLAGDFSTVRHLRNVDGLSWEQIAVSMGKTVNKVKEIYNRRF